ncbi:MAG: tryptophan-rich sensory protein [Erysipelotrichia bacterium]|nr:tryptophan-rich sensory protein [Erysipelotrichia bacterium]NCC54014.1 tryptophan-rich sensory protein [Erysipelotrichia bacterium]
MWYKMKERAFILSVILNSMFIFLTILLIRNHMYEYQNCNKPPFALSASLFLWSEVVNYLMMMISSYFIYQTKDTMKISALTINVIQLLLYFLWNIVFFIFAQYFLAVLLLLLLWMMVVIMLAAFYSVKKTAAYLQLFYMMWLSYMLYLNTGICIMNIM